jgi:transposase-like protein
MCAMAGPTESPVCKRCGRSRADAAPAEALAWSMENGRGGPSWLCPDCARTHVRDIEGKLPDEYS